MRRLAAAAAIALALTGCTHAEATAKPKPSPTGDPHDYARELITPAASLTTSYDKWRQTCDEGNDFGCSVTAITVDLSAQTLDLTLESLRLPKAKAYQPALTGEAARLYTETAADAKQLAAATKTYVDAQCNELAPIEEHTGACIRGKGAIEDAWSKVSVDLTSWEKYR